MSPARSVGGGEPSRRIQPGRHEVPGVVLRWAVFDNDFEQCAENIRQGSRHPEARLAKLGEFSQLYSATDDTPLERG